MTNQTPEPQPDRKDLKIQALLEKISNMAAQYENAAADYRVDLTVQGQQIEELSQLVQDQQSHIESLNSVQEDTDTTPDESD